MCKRALRLLKSKWTTIEEKPTRAFLKEGESSRSVGGEEWLESPRLQRNKAKVVSFVEDFLGDFSDDAQSLEFSWNKSDRKNVRRDSTCGEIEKRYFIRVMTCVS